MFFLAIWFLLRMYFVISLEKIYKVGFNEKYNYKEIVSVCLGSPPQCYPFKVSTGIGISFVLNGIFYKEGFQWNKSLTFKTIQMGASILYQSMKLIGCYVNDHFRIESTGFTIYNLEFFLIDDGAFLEKGIVGVLGLGYIKNISKSSFLQLSAQLNYIDNYAFYLSQKPIKAGFVQFGLSKNILEEYLTPPPQERRAKTCSIHNLKEEELNCELYSVIYYNERNDNDPIVIPGKLPLFFNNDLEGIICPLSFFELLKKNIFKKSLDGGGCYIKTKDNIEQILCNWPIDNEIKGDLIFIIGKWSIKFSFLKLYNQKFSGSTFYIKNTDKTKEYWVLGEILFNNYDVVVDYDHLLIYIK